MGRTNCQTCLEDKIKNLKEYDEGVREETGRGKYWQEPKHNRGKRINNTRILSFGGNQYRVFRKLIDEYKFVL